MKRKLNDLLIINLIFPQVIGFLSGLITNANKYNELQSPLPIPSAVFPIVWSILYLLMGIANYIYVRDTNKVSRLYITQLLVNFLWSIFFFGLDLRLFALLWAIFLLYLVVLTTKEFYNANKISGLLMIPYVLWLMFAVYLNFGFWILNKG